MHSIKLFLFRMRDLDVGGQVVCEMACAVHAIVLAFGTRFEINKLSDYIVKDGDLR